MNDIENSKVITHESMVSKLRTHDEFYSDVDPAAPPKHSFVATAQLIKEFKGARDQQLSIADFGCATGAFVNYASSQFPDDKVIGLEYLASLVKVGREFYPHLEILQGSILNENSLERRSVDVITVMGVLSIFDDVEPIVSNIERWIKPGGKAMIHGMFNPHDVDVFVSYRLSSNFGKHERETGWNIISQATISALFRKYGAREIQFHEFKMPEDLFPVPDDPMRSWTEKMANNDRAIFNATCLRQPQFILEVTFP